MEIGSVIREKRTAQGLTQEQVATALGVSAPAVSKWERGESFPEITLLPALARLLGTDLNGLLSFQQELSLIHILNHFLLPSTNHFSRPPELVGGP